MGNHGVVTYGADPYRAFFNMETVELFARITLVAELLGGPRVLPKTEVDKLLDSRTRYGVKSRNGAQPDCPVVAEDLSQNGKKLAFTRDQLVDLIDQVLKSHGLV
jgi:L-fuculose-phosphate aldolase